MPLDYYYKEDQHRQLERASESIGETIMEFYFNKKNTNPEFTANELCDYVEQRCLVAAGSAKRVLRNYKQQGRLNYIVTDRANSRYKFLYLY